MANESQPTPEQRLLPDRSRVLTRIARGLGLLASSALVYWLSFGPVALLVNRGVISANINPLYEPLCAVCREVPAFSKLTLMYLQLWRVFG